MDKKTAREIVTEMRDDEGQWINPLLVATDVIRPSAIGGLSRDEKLDGEIALVEIHLTQILPDIEQFEAIFSADNMGIWYSDDRDDVEGPIDRQRLIPWYFVRGLTLHRWQEVEALDEEGEAEGEDDGEVVGETSGEGGGGE